MRTRGFSLIECLLAVSMLAVLTLFANAWQAGAWHQQQRALARSALAQASWWIENEATGSGSFPPVVSDLAAPAPGLSYQLTVTQDAGAYVLRATPLGRQAHDPCGTLWLNGLGQRGAEGGVATCW
jgi:type IV pilus assembly protein PilE